MNGIDTSQIAAMAAQMRSAVSSMQRAAAPAASAGAASGTTAARGDFAQALKAQLDQVNALQEDSRKLGERFAIGDDSVNLSDVMMATQKSSIALQATVQVRNKLVTAYHDIMNMQV
jgi:flagellar hook-basal body complex protein FliE